MGKWAVLVAPPNPSIDVLIDALNHPTNAVFALHDDRGATMDCLKVVESGPRRYLGLYHALIDNRFELRLARSTDLRRWSFVRTLEDHAHQGDLKRVGAEWLVVSEKDGPGGNWIRVRVYAGRDEPTGDPLRVFDAKRTLSPAAEGTPTIDEVRRGKSWDDSRIVIGMHYYRDADVDRQAIGELTGFKSWSARPLSNRNARLETHFHGNVGGRDRFVWGGKTWTIQEAQVTKNDWSSWRVGLVGSDDVWRSAEPLTPGRSKSFANPKITELTLPTGKKGFVVTYFLPSQGAGPGESGEMLATFTAP